MADSTEAVQTKADKTIPNLENATPEFLVDEIAKLRIQAARIKFLDGIYKQALEARITDDQKSGKTPVVGDIFQASYADMIQERVDSDAVREMFKDDPVTLKKLIKTISFKQLNTRPKP